METKILVTYANVYDMVTEAGQQLRGCTLNYFFTGEDMEQFKPMQNLGNGAVGYQRAKCSIDFDQMNKIVFVPGIYNATLNMSVGADGKPALKVSDLTFDSKVELMPTN